MLNNFILHLLGKIPSRYVTAISTVKPDSKNTM